MVVIKNGDKETEINLPAELLCSFLFTYLNNMDLISIGQAGSQRFKHIFNVSVTCGSESESKIVTVYPNDINAGEGRVISNFPEKSFEAFGGKCGSSPSGLRES